MRGRAVLPGRRVRLPFRAVSGRFRPLRMAEWSQRPGAAVLGLSESPGIGALLPDDVCLRLALPELSGARGPFRRCWSCRRALLKLPEIGTALCGLVGAYQGDCWFSNFSGHQRAQRAPGACKHAGLLAGAFLRPPDDVN